MNRKYPALRNTVRLRKYKHFCWVIEILSGIDQSIMPAEAFLLASTTGEWSVDDLVYLFANVMNMSDGDASAYVESMFDRYATLIEWNDEVRIKQSRYNPASFLYSVDAKKAREVERLDEPVELILSLTHACNFRCIYCFNASDMPREDELSTEEWLDVIDQAHGAGVQKITLTGGEPMLHPGIASILTRIRDHDMLLCLCTNGSVLPEELCDLVESQVVQVSLDTADERIHERLTGLPTLSTVIGHIESLSKRGVFVQVKSVLTPLNIECVPDLMYVCSAVGVQKLILDRFDVSSSGRGNADLLLTEAMMDDVTAAVRDFAQKCDLPVYRAYHANLWQDASCIIPCAAFRRSLIFLPDGTVTACEKLVGVAEMNIGNIRDLSLLDLWHTKRINEILHPPGTDVDSDCKRCPEWSRCGSGCYALKHYYGHSLFGKDPRCRLSVV